MFGKIKKENTQLKDKNSLLGENIKILEKRLRDKDKEIKTLKFRLENPPKYKVGKKFDWGKIISVDLVEPTNIFKDKNFHQLVSLDLFRAFLLYKKAVPSNELKEYISQSTKYDWLYKFQLTTGDIMEARESEIENVNK